MDLNFFVLLIGFTIVSIAGYQIAKAFQKIKFPLITGLIITGIIAGSSVLKFIPHESLPKLRFLNDIALSIIAFSAGSELYLKELRSRLKSIKWMTIGQLVITFFLSTGVIYFTASHISFMSNLTPDVKIAIAMLFGTIFVARSPSSAIAVINEMRANGPFTKTAMGVTVVKDVLVIILFAVCFTVTKAIIHKEPLGLLFLFFLFIELTFSFAVGVLLGRIIQIPLTLKLNKHIKSVIILLLGYSIYLFASVVKVYSHQYFLHEITLEPLLICIIGSFVVTNYSKNRVEFTGLLEDISPTIYIIFFTLTGAALSFHTLIGVFWVAIALFGLRIVTLIIGGIFGVVASKDNKKFTFIAWMPYVTQAGVALGLTTLIANEFPSWGYEFETIIIAIIVLNQLIGPPLFKLAINIVGESRLKNKTPDFDGVKDAIIFGLENQSIALAVALKQHGWIPRIFCKTEDFIESNENFDIIPLTEFSLPNFKNLNIEKADVVVCLLSDSENYKISEIMYKDFGIKDIIARFNGSRVFLNKFNNLGVRIIDPSLAMVNLLDHFVRSPNATSILLGIDNSQDTIDVEIRNKDIHGLTLRDLRFPTDIIVLSVMRKGRIIISHGFTRLRLGDVVTLVGSKESVNNVRFKLES